MLTQDGEDVNALVMIGPWDICEYTFVGVNVFIAADLLTFIGPYTKVSSSQWDKINGRPPVPEDNNVENEGGVRVAGGSQGTSTRRCQGTGRLPGANRRKGAGRGR